MHTFIPRSRNLGNVYNLFLTLPGISRIWILWCMFCKISRNIFITTETQTILSCFHDQLRQSGSNKCLHIIWIVLKMNFYKLLCYSRNIDLAHWLRYEVVPEVVEVWKFPYIGLGVCNRQKTSKIPIFVYPSIEKIYL